MTAHDVPTILFDLDGTVLDPAGAITEGLSDAIAAHGFERPTPETLRKFVGPSTDSSLTQYTSIPSEYHQAILATYRGGYLDRARRVSRVYPGLVEILRDLSASRARVGIATQKPLPTTNTLLEDFGLTGYFDVVSGARDSLKPETRHLPHDKAGVIDRALTLLRDDAAGRGETLGPCVMVGDREHDVVGAAAHGMPCIGVSWGFGDPEELLNAGAECVVDDAAGLRRAIERATGVAVSSTSSGAPPTDPLS